MLIELFNIDSEETELVNTNKIINVERIIYSEGGGFFGGGIEKEGSRLYLDETYTIDVRETVEQIKSLELSAQAGQ